MWTLILLIFFVFSFLFRTDHSFDQDLGRHLKLGEIITQTNQIPKTNLFSYTNEDFPFINTHWFFEVFVYVWNTSLGLQSLLILKIIIFLFSVWLILKIVPKEKMALLLPIGFIFLHVLRERIQLRPEIFSFLFTASTYFILERYLKGPTRLIFLLPIIQLIWINTHIYFFVGLLLQAIYLIHNILSGKIKLMGVIFILSILVSLINPNGLIGLLYPLNVTKNYGYTIAENQTMFFLESIDFKDPNFLFAKLSVGLIILSLTLAFYGRRFELKAILLSIFGMSLALINVRGFPYLVFLSLPAVVQNFGAVKVNGLTKSLSLVTCALLLFESLFYLNGVYYRFRDQSDKPGLAFTESAKGALDFAVSKDLPNPIFNNFDIGSYIIYRGYPRYKVYVDGRPESYPQEFFLNSYIPTQYDYNKFKELNKQIGFKTIIFSHTDQTPWGKAFLQNVVKDESWKIVYIDDFMVILTTADMVNQKQLPVIDLLKLTTESYRFSSHVSYLRLGLFLLSTQNIESGKQFIEKTLQLFPNDPFANSLIGQNPKNIFFY